MTTQATWRTLPKLDTHLLGEDGNAFAIMGRISKACRRAGWPEDARQELLDEMMSGDYNHLIRTAMEVTIFYGDES